MQKVLTGNQTVSWGVMRARAQVIAAYPITPQTTIIEELANLVDEGKLEASFIKVESEHSALAGCIGAAQAGARTFTATSAQGLALMHELIHWASLGRLPIVLADVNRAMAPGWTIWTDQNDSLSQRDTGWLQFYCESNQEVMDTAIQAFKIAEIVKLPVMLVLDAFFLSHTAEAVDIPEPEEVDKFLPPYEADLKVDFDNPRAFSGMTGVDIYQEFRYLQHEAMNEALTVTEKVDQEYGKQFGRTYGLVEPYRCEDAEAIIVTTATATSTAREVIDQWRDRGESVGLLKIRTFRPFPTELVREALRGVPKVGILDRNICPGFGGIFAQEIKASMYDMEEKFRPDIYGFIAGLGGRDITPDTINEILEKTIHPEKTEKHLNWIALRD
ncbi:pyruvate ferredoxin oxidoreductase [candidate division LCP-89 bacterium B3_LCP]|uniref:Pyruvate ferredoxin oxidoreductase n=1 Tax=candidate division LCP-89 bacterium B3_LCP TaxID=2012998 RepID=A0A532UYY2_UNCL8|nr:MAG: pyruvate ferredoxin oxidoreductase [candidate division LCP-89 bacterium B3_LCP]